MLNIFKKIVTRSKKKQEVEEHEDELKRLACEAIMRGESIMYRVDVPRHCNIKGIKLFGGGGVK